MKYNLIFKNIKEPNNINITTNIFNNYTYIYNNAMVNLTTFKKISAFAYDFDNMSYINQKHGYFQKNINNNKNNKNIYSLDKILKKKDLNILLNKNLQINSTFEIFNKFNILNKYNDISILEICNLNINYNIIVYYLKKYYKNKKFNYELHNFIKYKYINTNKIYSNKYTKIIDSYININLIKQNNIKYNIIILNVSNNFIDSYEEYLGYFNNQLYFLFYLYSINKLNINGTLIFEIKTIMNKFVADIILYSKQIFKKVSLFESKIYNKYKYYGITLICENFKGISVVDFNKLINIGKQLLNNDYTSLQYNIKNKKIRKEYYISKELTKDSIFKFPISLLDIPDTSPKYDFIKKFNENFYMGKIIYLNKIRKYYKLYKDQKPPKQIKEQQLINSYLYAKEFDLETIPFDEGSFSSDFGKLIMNDMYCLHKPIIIEFNKRKNKLYKDKFKNISNNDNTNLISICDELNKISSLFHIIMSAIDSRNIKNWNSEKKKSRYYDKGIYGLDKLKTLVSNKYNNGFELSQAWLKMYEICTLFNIISKKKKTFNSIHICELPGNFIAAINHYIKTKTDIKEFNWIGQSLNPYHKDNIKKYGKSIINEKPYNFYTYYPNNWNFGKDNTGDITNIENIKYYKSICKNINLLTSDCGLGWTGSQDITLKKVHFASIVFMFNNLPKNGNFVAKFVLPIDELLEIDMIYLMYKQFKKIYIYKPLQNMYSGEFYLIGIKYNPISETYLKRMFKILKTFNKESFNQRIQKSKYPKSFTHQIFKAINDITNNWIFYIKRQFYYTDNKDYIPKEHYDTLKKYIYQKNIDWIKQFKIKKINKKDML